MKDLPRASADPTDIQGARKQPMKLVARSKTRIDFDKYSDAEKVKWLGKARKVMKKQRGKEKWEK